MHSFHLDQNFSAPIITFISETYSNMNQSANTIRDFHVPNHHIMPSIGILGCLWLFWNNIYNLHITSSSPNHIMVEIQIVTRLPVGILSAAKESQTNTRDESSENTSVVLSLTLLYLFYVLVTLALFLHKQKNLVVNKSIGIRLSILIKF